MAGGHADRAVAQVDAPSQTVASNEGVTMFHNILVAVDGSAHADQALTEAIDLAGSENARLTLITGVPDVPWSVYLSGGSAVPDLVADAQAESEAILRRARDRVPQDISVTTLLTHQPIGPAVIRQIKAGHHDLVMMGSRGRGAVRSAVLGSVSHFVLHHSPVPVLINQAEPSSKSEPRIPAPG
jgi:nucleotide-binding universal stress UspA family protein